MFPRVPNKQKTKRPVSSWGVFRRLNTFLEGIWRPSFLLCGFGSGWFWNQRRAFIYVSLRVFCEDFHFFFKQMMPCALALNGELGQNLPLNAQPA